MRNNTCASAFALALACSWVLAADGSKDIGADRLRAHIAFLADDALEGRATASRGHEIAAAYVASQFAAYGLKPLGDRGSWYQAVPLLESSAVIAAASAHLERDGVSTELISATDFLPRASFAAGDVSVSGPLTFVGFAVHAPDLNYDDFAGVDLKGRVAVILNGAPAAFPVDRRAYYASGAVKAGELAARGAIGVITIGAPVEDPAPTWERRLALSWIPSMRWIDESGNPVDAFVSIRGSLLFGPQGTAKMFQGAAHTLDEVFALAVQSKPQAFELPGRITFSVKSVLTPRSSMNVVALLEGKDAELKAEYLVVSAHLDHLGMSPAHDGDTIFNGALDNASGVAMLLESARVLAANASRIRRSILFIAVTGEEKGLLGSEYFLHFPPVPRASMVANINIDMPTAITQFTDLVAIGSGHSSLAQAAITAVLQESLDLSPDPWPEELRFVRSDQFSFVRNGIPAILIDVGTHAAHSDTNGYALIDEFRHSRYHQPGDDLSQPIDYRFLARLARVNVHLAYEIANARKRPQWNAGDFFAEKFGNAR
jgi:Zn-dependent M28 family amino/carboxypeptidase